MISPLRSSGYYDPSARICLEGPEQTDFAGADTPFTDADAILARQLRRLAERLDELRKRDAYFDDRASSVIRKIADRFSGAGVLYQKFKQSLGRAGSQLERGNLARQQGRWGQAHRSLQDVRMQIELAGDFWRDYIATSSGGAEAVVRDLRLVRNVSGGFVGGGAGALVLGAGTAMAGALAASASIHAGFLSLAFREQEITAPPEIITLEVVDLGEEEGRRSTTTDAENAERVGNLPEEAPPAKTGNAYRRPKRSFKGSGTRQPSKIGAAAKGKKKPEESRPAVSLRMREEDVPPDEPVPLQKLYPSQAALERIIKQDPALRQNRPHPVVQDPTGAYHRYADGGTLVRNPELGLHRVSQEVAVDDRITVEKYGNVYGVEEKAGRQGRTDFLGEVDVALLERNARKLASLCDIYRDPAADPGFFSNLNIFVDSSGSMGANFYVAPATTCAYQAALSALDTNALVRIFNFSSDTYHTEQTRDKRRIAKAIALYEGFGTYLPTVPLEPLQWEKAKNDIIIVSDGYIANYQKALPYFWAILHRNQRNRGYFVVIGKAVSDDQDRQKCIEEFKNIGFKVLFHG